MLSTRKHREPYQAPADLTERLREIETLLASILGLAFPPNVKIRILKNTLWEVVHATGNWYGRYRSQAVVNNEGIEIERDHIFELKWLVEGILKSPDEIKECVARAECCVVTAEEHRRLHQLPREIRGWERYKSAGIVVKDSSIAAPSTPRRTFSMPYLGEMRALQQIKNDKFYRLLAAPATEPKGRQRQIVLGILLDTKSPMTLDEIADRAAARGLVAVGGVRPSCQYHLNALVKMGVAEASPHLCDWTASNQP